MSNVLERHRGISEMEFYVTAINIRHELTTFLMHEKNVPKRWRSVYTYPVINLSQAQIDLIIKANDVFAFKPEQVEYIRITDTWMIHISFTKVKRHLPR